MSTYIEMAEHSIVSRSAVACKSCPTSPCQFPSADSRQVGGHSGYDTLTQVLLEYREK